MSILNKLKKNQKFINLIFFKGFGSGLGLLIYTIVLNFFGNYFALAHSGFVTSYQVSQAGCTFERNLNGNSAFKTFTKNIYHRLIFSFLWLVILFLVFEVDLYFLCFFGSFISFVYLIYFDNHTEFKSKSSFILAMVPLITIATVSILFYLFPINLSDFYLKYGGLNFQIISIIFLLTLIIGLIINNKNKFFFFEILYSSIPIFILSYLIKNQINEKITFYLIILYKVLEFLFAGCYFALTGTKKIKSVLGNFFLVKKYYSILLIFLTIIILVFQINEPISIFLVLWIFLFRITSFMLLSYKVVVSVAYVICSILLINFSFYLYEFIFIFVLILPNIVILIFQKKMNYKNFFNIKL